MEEACTAMNGLKWTHLLVLCFAAQQFYIPSLPLQKKSLFWISSCLLTLNWCFIVPLINYIVEDFSTNSCTTSLWPQKKKIFSIWSRSVLTGFLFESLLPFFFFKSLDFLTRFSFIFLRQLMSTSYKFQKKKKYFPTTFFHLRLGIHPKQIAGATVMCIQPRNDENKKKMEHFGSGCMQCILIISVSK